MNKTISHALLMALLLSALGFGACGKGERAAIPAGADSLYSVAYIQGIAISEPERALALLDTAEAQGRLSAFDLNDLRCQVYHNGLSRYKTAYTYAREAYADPEARADTGRFLSLVAIMADECHTNGDYAGSVAYCAEGLRLARETGDRAAEAKLYVTWGLNLLEMKQYDEAFSRIDRAVDVLRAEADKRPCYNTWDGLVHALGMKLSLLWDKDRYREALATRSLMEEALRGLAESDDTPEGAVDMRRAETDVIYCCVAYALGDTARAERFYARVVANPYASAPDGEYIRVPCLLLAGRYDEALFYLDREERLLKSTTDTLNSDYIDPHLQMKLEAYQGKKDWRSASRVQASMLAVADSLRQRERDAHAQELAEIYKTEDQARHIERQKTALFVHRVGIACAAGLLVIALLFTLRVWRYTRVIRRKNRAMSNTIDELMDYKEDVRRLREENLRLRDEAERGAAMVNGDAPEGEETPTEAAATDPRAAEEEKEADEGNVRVALTERDRLLFDRVTREITGRKLYLRPNFSKKELLKEVHVPANKFSSLFKTFAGCGFSQYVQELRMDEAIRLMREHPDWSMDAVAREVRMSNGAFYKQFQRKYGMKPSQYRRGAGSSHPAD